MRRVRLPLVILVIMLAAFNFASDHFREDLYQLAIQFEASQADLTPKQVTIDGRSYAYLENSSQDKLGTLIMLHGFSANKENWLRFSAQLADQYHIIALDLMGHGDSHGDLSQSYSIVKQVDFLKQFTQVLKLNTFHLVGNSMGGAISSLYAANYPEQVESVVLISPAGVHKIPSRMDEILKTGKNPLIASSVEEFDALMHFVMEDLPYIPDAITKVEAEKSVQRLQLNQKIFSDIRSDMDKGLEKKFSDIKAPTLIIWGDHDRAINVANIDQYAQLIPGSEKLVLEGIGHLAMLEAPKVSAQAMLKFLKKSS